MKKTALWIAAVCGFILFEIFTAYGTEAVLYFSYIEADSEALVAGMAITIIPAILLAVEMNFINRSYDRVTGFAGKPRLIGRWTKNTLLAGLVTIFIVIMIMLPELPQIRQMDSSSVSTGIIFCFAAVLAGVYVYIANYHKTKDVGARVHDLINENVLEKGRRYTLLVEKIFSDEPNSVKMQGIIHGEIHTGDSVYANVLGPEEKVYKIASLESGGTIVHQVKNAEVILKLSGEIKPEDFPVFTVISDIHTFSADMHSGVNNTENPYLVAVLGEYTRFQQNDKYWNLLYYSICHAHYLIVGTAQNKRPEGDIMDVPQNHTDIGFTSVTQTGRQDQMLPVYTDWEALWNWKDVVNGDKCVTLTTSFPQIVGMLHDSFSGIVINPFGPRPFALSLEMIHNIVSSQGYQKDFVQNQNKE